MPFQHIPYNPANDPLYYIGQGLNQLFSGLGQGLAKREQSALLGKDIESIQSHQRQMEQFQRQQALFASQGPLPQQQTVNFLGSEYPVGGGFEGPRVPAPGQPPAPPTLQSPQLRQAQAMGLLGSITPITPYQSAQLNQPELQIVDSGENKAIFDKKTGQIYPTQMPSSRVPSTNVNIQPSAGERTAIAETRASIDSLDNLKNLFDNPNTKTGPIVGRIEPTKGLLGATTPEQEAFMAATSTFKNAIIKEITGAQMSEPEARRIMKQIPDITDPTERWKAKWQQSKKNLEMLQKRRLEILGQAGASLPSQENATVNEEVMINPQTGQRIVLRNGKWVQIK